MLTGRSANGSVSYSTPQSVDYKGMLGNPAFDRYCELAVQLQRVELLSLSREEKLAFFINIYNALVIHGSLRLGAPTNMWQRYRVGYACLFKKKILQLQKASKGG